jgi:hypothetical protein
MKCYEDWKWCDRKLSFQNLSNVWIRTDDRGLGHNLIWGDMWIGTDYELCCHDQIDSAICIGKDGIRNIHDKFEIIYALHQIWKNAFMT